MRTVSVTTATNGEIDGVNDYVQWLRDCTIPIQDAN